MNIMNLYFMQTKFFLYVKSIVLFAVLAWFSIGFFQTLAVWKAIVVFPGDTDFTEGIVLYEANQLREGHSIYPTGEGYPFVSSNFGPILYILHAMVSSFEPDSYFPNRILSLVGILLLVLSFTVFIWLQSRSWIAAVFALFLSIWPFSIIVFGPTLKPDPLALGFIFAGLFWALHYFNTNKVFWAVPFFVVAVFIKQTSLVAPAFITLLLLWRDLKRGLYFILTGVLLGALFYIGFSFYFGWENFAEHFIIYNLHQTLDPERKYFAPYLLFAVSFWPLLLLSVLSCIYLRKTWLLLYPLLASLFHLFMMSKAGSFINYWNEPLLAWVLPVPLAIGQLSKDKETSFLQGVLVLGLLYFAWFDQHFYYYRHPNFGRVAPSQESYIALQKFEEAFEALIKDQKPIIYTSNPGLVARYRKRIRLLSDDPFLMKQHFDTGVRDESLFLRRIQREKIDIIIIVDQKGAQFEDRVLRTRISRKQFQMIQKHYQLLASYRMTQYYYGALIAKDEKFQELFAYIFVPK